MIKKYLLPIIFLAASIICGILYNMKGQTIAPDGTLKEAFTFIPLAWLFVFIAIISFAFITIKNLINENKK